MNVLSSKKVKIRKARRCWGCCTLFAVGQELTVTASVDCGTISSAYWCHECMSTDLDSLGFDRSEGIGYGEIALAKKENNEHKPQS